MAKFVLGISAFYHDSAAALISDGKIIGAVQEERFTRKKQDSVFPYFSIKYLLEEHQITFDEIDSIAFYDKPFLKFERLLETYHAFAPKGLISFCSAMPVWIREKLFLKSILRKELSRLGDKRHDIFFPEHHLSHSASAYYPSPFDEAAILTLDGVGEWATMTISHGMGNKIKVLKELHFPHSVGLLYSAFTYFCGFKVNSGEYKLMGLAPYGDKESEETKAFIKKIKETLVDTREDGSFLLNMKYFKFATGKKMIHSRRWEKLFELSPRTPESEITQSYKNFSLAAQIIIEEIFLNLSKLSKELTGSKNIVLAGGVALNSVANGKLLRSELFENIWVQPASGDAGGSIGSALAVDYLANDIQKNNSIEDGMNGALLGPEFSDEEVQEFITKKEISKVSKLVTDELLEVTAKLINEGKVIGWFQGKMEFGPRALGNRSILADPRNKNIQERVNALVKNRESFRPFAPSVLVEEVLNYFELDTDSPYMLLVAPVKEEHRKSLPAITHVDGSARIQTVSKKSNSKYYALLQEFKKQTGCPLLLNTSFNVRGEPIVNSLDDAYNCFLNTNLDKLVLGNFLFSK